MDANLRPPQLYVSTGRWAPPDVGEEFSVTNYICDTIYTFIYFYFLLYTQSVQQVPGHQIAHKSGIRLHINYERLRKKK